MDWDIAVINNGINQKFSILSTLLSEDGLPIFRLLVITFQTLKNLTPLELLTYLLFRFSHLPTVLSSSFPLYLV